MEKKHFAFGKENFILLAVSVVIIVIGFILMSGAKTTEGPGGFDPKIFDTRRIVIAPVVTLAGFVTVIYAILKKPKEFDMNDKKIKK